MNPKAHDLRSNIVEPVVLPFCDLGAIYDLLDPREKQLVRRFQGRASVRVSHRARRTSVSMDRARAMGAETHEALRQNSDLSINTHKPNAPV